MNNFIKIGVVARILDCDQQTIRRYDRLGLFAPRRDRAGHRVYGAEDIEAIRVLKASRKPGRPPKNRGRPR
jgi:DNA-binding transcriptional MerR regulator